MREDVIELRTLTPLWTGGFEGRMDRVHETGLIGSLRWWYEALVRGAGGKVCDPTGETRCVFDPKLYKETVGAERERRRAAKLCDVCQLFGATGWRRRFRLEVDDSQLTTEEPPCPGSPQGQCCLDPRARKYCWAIKPGCEGDFDLHLLGEKNDIAIVHALLGWVVPRAGIGARTQLGYGVVALREAVPDVQPLRDDLDKLAGLRAEHLAGLPGEGTTAANLPSRERMFGAELTLTTNRHPGNPVLELLTTKRELRNTWFHPPKVQMDDEKARTFRHRILGTIRDGRQGSKINISRPFYLTDDATDWTMRIWLWTPQRDETKVRELVDAYIATRQTGKTLEPLTL